MSETPRPVDDLRAQLRALGYLDARVDRFVLGAAAGRTRAGALVAAASLRIGLLAGALLGPAAAAGAGARVPGLVTGVSDAVVLALYLGVLFAMAAALTAAAAVLAFGRLARQSSARPDFGRRARVAATMAGLLIGVGCLTYLAFWWRAAGGVAESASLLTTSSGLAIAVATSALIGHAVTITVLAYLTGLGYAGSLERRGRLSSWRRVVLVGAGAFLGALALLIATAPRPAVAEVPPLTVVPTGQRVVVIAIDGVDLPTLDRLVAAGRLPTFSALMSGAVAAGLGRVDTDRDPARLWTTIATGQLPEVHGIRGLEVRQIQGVSGRLRLDSPLVTVLTSATDLLRLTQPTVASGDERLRPAFWEVAARAGLRTAVVNWWATWPAPQDLGIVFTDRAVLRLEHGGPLDAEIAPAELYEPLRAGWPARRARAQAAATAAVLPGASAEVSSAITRSAELDAIALDLAPDRPFEALDLLAIYLPGLDIAQHALLGAPAGRAISPSAMNDHVAALEQYYRFLDASIAALLARPPAAGRTVVLVTDPGRVSPPSESAIAISGAPVQPTQFRNSSHGFDASVAVAPAVLYLLGVPVARDLAGAGVPIGIREDFVKRYPLRTVATYGTRTAAARASGGKPLDREMIERMRSLGYVR